MRASWNASLDEKQFILSQLLGCLGNSRIWAMIISWLILGVGIALGRLALSRVKWLVRFASPHISKKHIMILKSISFILGFLALFMVRHVAYNYVQIRDLSSQTGDQLIVQANHILKLGTVITFPIFSFVVGMFAIFALIIHNLSAQRSLHKSTLPSTDNVSKRPTGRTWLLRLLTLATVIRYPIFSLVVGMFTIIVALIIHRFGAQRSLHKLTLLSRDNVSARPSGRTCLLLLWIQALFLLIAFGFYLKL